MAEAEEVLNTSQVLSVVCQSDIVFSHPGDEVVLSCHLKPAISAASMEIQWWHKEDPVFLYKDGRVTVNIDFEGRVSLPLENLHNGNVSLTLRDVRRSQKGLYICEVTSESQLIQDTVFLHISSVDFSLVAPSDTLSADPGSDVILPVHLSPETSAVSMEIRWFKGKELIYQYMNGQEMTNNDFENRVSLSIQELRSGNLALTLRNVQQSDSGVYTCKVFHDGCQKRGVVHLKVKEIERVNHLRSVLKQAHEDITQQRVKLNETINLLEETLSHDDRSCRHINSMEGMPPFMQDQSNQERCDIEDGRAGSTCRPTSKDTSSQVLQRLRRSEGVSLTERATQTQQSPEATMQSTQERRQETVAAEQERSSPAVQPQTQEREETSQSHSAEGRGQRRRETRERNCQIL
ncbi:junctional adhesion molecule-like isoform X3 [Onychostoma macrolepis]|uniref:junctional adhesion molecule-like isoform X3 n=1 Tax=Onychostoma macrolepis TaxID=369639 RepID=UPI0027295331|nr:junctional adhesion molecule-like isoform X3 [Onychostoma macrolepis]